MNSLTSFSINPCIRSAGADDDPQELIEFLESRGAQAAILRAMVGAHGFDERLNRGKVYVCRNEPGVIEGAALVGHLTLIESDREWLRDDLLKLAVRDHRVRLIGGRRDQMTRDWQQVCTFWSTPPRIMRGKIFELTTPRLRHRWLDSVLGRFTRKVRLATFNDLEEVVRVHAESLHEERGVNPMEKDAVPFRVRLARFIRSGSVWVNTEENELRFKLLVLSLTPRSAYLEGLYVRPADRATDFGEACLIELAAQLLRRTRVLYIHADGESEWEQSLLVDVGFKLGCQYDLYQVQTPVNV